MNPAERWAFISDVLSRALDLPEAERTRFLSEVGRRQPTLRTEILALYEELPAAEEFLETAATAPLPAAGAEPRFGAYRVVGELGEGGMGVVYLAERSDGQFTRRVAIKRVGRAAASVDLLQRFRDERQILARLDHPHIARLLDAGVDAASVPYLVMEHVEGVPLTVHCQVRSLSVPQRLALFLKVCAAVQHAHQNLVVHRDIKPSNIMVTDAGDPKLLDFGIAKVVSETLAGDATRTVNRALTLGYASPEQLRGEPVTASSDVYSLGVVLFELLADARPYEVSGLSLAEALHVVCDETPQPPSRVAPAERRGAIAGDLDSIVRMSLEKAPADRYGSVAALADDLERHRLGMPVRARPDSLTYRIAKFVGRHRAAVLAASLAAFGLLVALGAAVHQARVAARERERAVARFNDVRQLAGALIFKIHDEVAPLAGSTPVRETVIAEGLKFLERLEQDAGGDPSLRLELARAYLRIGAVQGKIGAANLGQRTAALRSYRKARALAAPLAGEADEPWDAVATRVDAYLALSNLAEGDERRDAAAAALESAKAWGRREPASIRARTLLARAYFQMAILGGPQGALPHWLESNRLFREVLADDPSDLTRIRNVALTEKYLGGFYDDRGDPERALEHNRRAYALDEQRVAAAPNDRQVQIDFAIDIGNIAFALMQRKEDTEAVVMYHRTLEIRERLAASDPKDVYMRGRVAFVHDKLARLYLRTGQIALAQSHSRTAVSLTDAAGPLAVLDHQLVDALHTLGSSERAAGREEAACAAYGRALAILQGSKDTERRPFLRGQAEDLQRRSASCGARGAPAH